jgi:Ca-activated chloride channel family protein
MRQGLLPDMAAQFNKAGHKTKSGKRIVVKTFSYDSFAQVADLASRATRGVPLNPELPDPTIVTPQADHWLIYGSYIAGRPLVDLSKSKSIARAFIGIVTYRDMAECLGWPKKEIGYADIIALRDDPRGWRSYPCAKAEWGQRPLVAYTDPVTSTTGRGALFTLYSIASGKPLDQLTAADVTDPKVVGYVKRFQGLVDHYMPGTIPLNTKVHQGPRYGHFFMMPEDNLIHLYEGTESIIGPDGMRVKAPPISRPMVMIYPKEGSTIHNNSASIVQASWVTEEHVKAAERWVEFIRKDENQRAFIAAGFRPGTNLPLTDPISGKYGLDPTKPTAVINPDRIDQEAAAAIVESWEDVKRPGIVTFVLDVSGSMSGNKIEQAKDGLIRAIDAMAKNNSVGFLTFDDAIKTRIEVTPLAENRFVIADAVQEARVGGQTALYDAIKAGIEMTDAAPGEGRAIRGVVVLTDGQANAGRTQLDDLVRMMSRNEITIQQFEGFEKSSAVEEGGKVVYKNDVVGTGLAMKTRYPIQVFFIGIGDADMEIGRILAGATGAEFQGATEKDLANVLEQFSKYF